MEIAIRKAKQGSKSRNQTMTYHFDVEKCLNCEKFIGHKGTALVEIP